MEQEMNQSVKTSKTLIIVISIILITSLVFMGIFAHDYEYLRKNFDSSEGTIIFDTKNEALGLAIGLGILSLLLLVYLIYLIRKK